MSDASASVKPDRFKRLLKTLNQSELEMTGYELAICVGYCSIGLKL